MKKVYLIVDEYADPSVIARVHSILKEHNYPYFSFTHDNSEHKYKDESGMWSNEVGLSASNIQTTDVFMLIPHKQDVHFGKDLRDHKISIDEQSFQRLEHALMNHTHDFKKAGNNLNFSSFTNGKEILVLSSISDVSPRLTVQRITGTENNSSGVADPSENNDATFAHMKYGNTKFDILELMGGVNHDVVAQPKVTEGKLKVYISKSNLADPQVYTNVRTVLREFDVDIVEWDMASSMPTRNQYDRMNACDILLVIPPKSTLNTSTFVGDYKIGKGQHDMIVAFTDENKIFAMTMANDTETTVRKVLSLSTYESGDWKDRYAHLNLASMDYLRALLGSSIHARNQGPVPTDSSGKPVDTGYQMSIHLGAALILKILK